MSLTLLRKAFFRLSSQPDLAIAGFRGCGLFPINKSYPLEKIISITDEEVNTPTKAMREAVQQVLAPPVDPDIAKAVKAKSQKRKRVQADAGEVLTETAVERLRIEEEERLTKKSSGKAKGGKKNQRKKDLSENSALDETASSAQQDSVNSDQDIAGLKPFLCLSSLVLFTISNVLSLSRSCRC